MRAGSLIILKSAVLRNLIMDLGERKLCAGFFPHSLSPEKREDQVTSLKVIIAMANANNSFMKLISGNETWCFAC